eukprot:gb/GECG01002146.1/.p1 GENE.gb/GECG01002146.1/~~gb/GECG01002146.1/.p1  ORF type:complete len:133 (+),score=4.42 gb/GECG01002146.1/:1-399(+)
MLASSPFCFIRFDFFLVLYSVIQQQHETILNLISIPPLLQAIVDVPGNLFVDLNKVELSKLAKCRLHLREEPISHVCKDLMLCDSRKGTSWYATPVIADCPHTPFGRNPHKLVQRHSKNLTNYCNALFMKSH